MGHLRSAIFAACALLAAACGSGAPSVSDPAPTARGLPTPDLPGRLVRLDNVALSADKRVVTLDFVGSPEYEPSNPCGNAYSAGAEVDGDELEVAVYERGAPGALPLLPPMGCPAVGAFRTLSVELPQPFDGSTVRDKGGSVFFVAAPDGLADLAGLEPDWRLVDEHDVEESRTGRWVRVYSKVDALPSQSGPGRLDIYQAFDGRVDVTGTEPKPDVEINSEVGKVWTWSETGEIVVSWWLSGDGLAIVANEADFSIDELVALAESAVLPSD